MNIEIETNFIPLLLVYNDLPDGITKRIIPSVERRDIFSEPTAVAIFTIAAGAVGGTVANVFGSWIYDKIKNKHQAKIKINRREVTIEKSEIIKVLSEEIEIEKNN